MNIKRLITKTEAIQLLDDTRIAGIHMPEPNVGKQSLLKKQYEKGDPLDTGEGIVYVNDTKHLMGGHDYLYFLSNLPDDASGMVLPESSGKLDHAPFAGRFVKIGFADALRMLPGRTTKLPPDQHFGRSISVLKLYAQLKQMPIGDDPHLYSVSIDDDEVDRYVAFHTHPGLTDNNAIRSALLKHSSEVPLTPEILNIVVGGLQMARTVSPLQAAVYNQLYELTNASQGLGKKGLSVAKFAKELLAISDIKKIKLYNKIRRALNNM